MSLQQMAFEDAGRILGDPTGFTSLGTFQNPESPDQTCEVWGTFNDVPSQIDTETGLPIVTGGITFTVHSSAFAAVSPGNRWSLDVQIRGRVRRLRVTKVYRDKALGVVLFHLGERGRG